MNKLRSRNVDVKCNFKTKFTFNNIQRLECPIFGCYDIDDQQHLMKCKYLKGNLKNTDLLSNVKYDDIFADIRRQSNITKLYIKLIEIRENLLKKQQNQI